MSPQTDNALPFDSAETIEKSVLVSQQHVLNLRKYLLILTFIPWLISLVILSIGIYVVSVDDSASVSNAVESLLPLLVFSIYYTFGLLVTKQLNRIGLLVFGILGVILFTILYIFIGYFLLILVALGVGFGDSNQLNYSIAGFGIFLALLMIVVIFTLKLAFNLAKLIANTEYTTL